MQYLTEGKAFIASGINRIKNALKEAGLPEPEFEFTGFFSISFKRIKVGETVENYSGK